LRRGNTIYDSARRLGRKVASLQEGAIRVAFAALRPQQHALGKEASARETHNARQNEIK
jgi:hypothetical protein